MFNWSWELRKQTGFISPQGPSFNRARWHHILLSDTRIVVKVPRHRTHLPVESYDTFGNVDIKNLNFKNYEKHTRKQRSASVIYRAWKFYGPWFTGSMGGIEFSGVVVSALKPTSGLNYFHPRALESAIVEYLTYDYSNEFSVVNREQLWFGPMNWRQQMGFPCIAARFDVARPSAPHFGPHSYLVFPLTKTHYFVFECSVLRPSVFPTKTVDEWIDPQPFLTLIDQVLNSVQIELSPQAKADQEEALHGLADHEKELVKEFPPLKWIASEEPKKEQGDDDDGIFLGQIIKTK